MLALRICGTIIVAAWTVVLALAFLLNAIDDFKAKNEYVHEFIVCFSALITLGYVIYVLWVL